MTKLALMTAVIALLAGGAFAQTSSTSPSTGSTATGAQHMSEAQIKQKLEQEGYSNLKLERESHSRSMSGSSTSGSGTSGTSASGASEPEYTGTATKNGKTVHIDVDAQGQVHEKQK
jgi:hypothetical protein